MALSTTRHKMDYLNTHGTSTPVGDINAFKAVGETYGLEIAKISSKKACTVCQ